MGEAMHYWYPTENRVVALRRSLEALEGLVVEQAPYGADYITEISSELAKAGCRSDFPGYQMPRWVWLASQLRLHSGGTDLVAIKAGAALRFLAQRLSSNPLPDADVQDLNWVLDSTIRVLSQMIPAQDLRSCLSAEELAQVDARLARYAGIDDFDVPTVRSAVTKQLEVIRSFSVMKELADFGLKVEALFDAASGTSGGGQAARAALLYLAEQDDVVADTTGFLGLIDDIYVIEWAYAAVESQTRCLPILEGMIRNWPFVADLAVLESGRVSLDRFSQYVVCAAMQSLFGDALAGVLVLRETGAYPLLAATMTAIECARRHTHHLGTEAASWPLGQPVFVSDGVTTFRATFEGAQDLHGLRYRLGVRSAGVIMVGESTLPYVSRAPKPHGRLSTGNEISVWLKERHVDPLANLTGTGRWCSSRHDAVLLLGPKHKLDELTDSIRPLGITPQALLGMRYVNTHHETSDGKKSTMEHPLIYACSDPSVAIDLLREPPEHVASWNVIVDGARLGRSFCSVSEAKPALARTPICVLAELYDREATADLIGFGLNRIWYLEDQDVEVPLPVSSAGSTNLLQRVLARRSAHWSSSHALHGFEDDFLEGVAECLRNYGPDPERAREVSLLHLTVSIFLQKALSCPLHVPEVLDELRTIGSSISAQASVLRQFDQTAARTYELFRPFVDGEKALKSRGRKVSEIAGTTRNGESIAIVCRSARIAEQCHAAAREAETLAEVDWLNIERLRREAPYDRIVVPAWLDRLSMRELALNGYAPRLDFVFLPFEQRWFEGTTKAIRRWERQLENRTIERLSATTKAIGNPGGLARRWRGQTELRFATSPVVAVKDEEWEDDEPDTEQLEVRAVEAMARVVASKRRQDPLGQAQLVLFEDPGTYAFLPPNGRVIVLPDSIVRGDRNTEKHREKAERILTRNVAELHPGMVLAFSLGADRDLIDAKADQFLADADTVRQCAALWKTALRRNVGEDDGSIVELCRRMSEAGHSRDPMTVRFWIRYDHTIAPRNYRTVIPLLGALTEDNELKSRESEVLQAVDLLYRARTRAAEAIIGQLFSGEIDLAQPTLTFSIEDKQIQYALHRIRRIGDICSVPADMIGKLSPFDSLSGAAA